MTNKSKTIKVAANGRMILPLEIRKALNVEGGGVLVVSLVAGDVKLSSVRQGLAQAQAIFRKYVKEGIGSDEFLAARRYEARRSIVRDSE